MKESDHLLTNVHEIKNIRSELTIRLFKFAEGGETNTALFE